MRSAETADTSAHARNGTDQGKVSRRSILLGGTTLAAASLMAAGNSVRTAQAQEVLPLPEPPFRGTIGRSTRTQLATE
ncbi:MAG: hypothetical protein LBV73_29555 [Paraburkholderia sp.]|jgi:hypothetical protein|nr:hypothetical protein [Paraburkholderia sp.]